jgi:hypothetical protein
MLTRAGPARQSPLTGHHQCAPLQSQVLRCDGVDSAEFSEDVDLAAGGPNSGSMTGLKPGTRVHMRTQIVGKVRMALTPMLNHRWHVTLYVTPQGLSPTTIPYGGGAFDIEFDFCGHRLDVRSSDGTAGSVVLGPKSVAAFHLRPSCRPDVLAAVDPGGPGPERIPFPLQGQGRLSAASLELRTFAARLRLTHLYFEADSIAGQALMRAVQVETGDLPVVITPYKVMRRTTAEIMARELGLSYRRAANQ